MSEKINAKQFVNEVAKENGVVINGTEFVHNGYHELGEGNYISKRGFAPEDGRVAVTHDGGRAGNSSSISYRDRSMHGYSEHANTSDTVQDTWVRYKGDITPRQFGIEPQVSRIHRDPETGEKTEYKHTFKDPKNAGQLIAKLAAKRIRNEISDKEQESEVERAA
ncbi:MAG: hypothetical protein QG593_317 [Patescibacteria group bacterium]|jgi:hypothetical protein|nr:hypothetical protein [Patescibacteria group bacterium]